MKRFGKIFVLAFAAVMMCAPAMAGEIPEFDAVGCDANSYFALDVPHLTVTIGNEYSNGIFCLLNTASDFTKMKFDDYLGWTYDCTQPEFFRVNSGGGPLEADLCYPDFCILGVHFSNQTVITTAGNGTEYEWQIVLQSKPATDLNIAIHDCVTKPDADTLFGSTPFNGAAQTGRTFLPGGGSSYADLGAPRVTAKAIAGPFATQLFKIAKSFTLDTRAQLATDTLVPLVDYPYVSKALWAESIVVAKPLSGLYGYTLNRGDRINVQITVPEGYNPVDLRYGPASVLVEYVGESNALYGTQASTCPIDDIRPAFGL